MRVLDLELGPFASRCVVLAAEDGEAIVVDPGFEAEEVVALLAREGLRATALVLTHAHLDHALGAATLKAAFPEAPLMLHAGDLPLYENLAMQARAFGFNAPQAPPVDRLLADGDRLELGGVALTVRHCPGHSPGHIVLLAESLQPPLAVVGDVLFAGSIGRTDLWGGSYEALERSIRSVLYRLPDATRVIPGHGPETTIGEERASNPFVTG